MKRLLFLLALVSIISSCTINQKITYKTDDIQSQSNEKRSEIILSIQELGDKRKENPENKNHFVKPRQFKSDRQVCINAEKHYIKKPVNQQVSDLLVDHLNKRGAFQVVVKNNKDTADYYLVGNLTQLYGKQYFSTAAATGAQFGLIGAAATAGAKTKGTIKIEITDLKIYNKSNELVKDLGTFKKEYVEDFPADAYCWYIYENVNAKLKEYFSELSNVIETEISAVEQ